MFASMYWYIFFVYIYSVGFDIAYSRLTGNAKASSGGISK